MQQLLLVGATTPVVVEGDVNGRGGGRCASVKVASLLGSMMVIRRLSYP
jgi:hypothetical protein